MFLRNALGGRAETRDRLGRYAEALTDLDQAIELAADADKPKFRAARQVTEVKEALTRDLAWPLLWSRPPW
jgi:hypothetical protein